MNCECVDSCWHALTYRKAKLELVELSWKREKYNLVKYTIPDSTLPTLIVTLAMSFINTLPLQSKFYLSLKSVIIIIVNSALTSIPQLPVPLLTPTLITAILFATTSISLM